MPQTGAPAAVLTLPITRWQARLYRPDGHFPTLHLQPVIGPPVISTLILHAANGQILLGAHREITFGPSKTITAQAALAYGVLPITGPPEVAFNRHRVLRPARRSTALPAVLGDLVWLAEAAGQFDEVLIATGGHIHSRLI